eukprot:5607974-Pyramimonas_sp.AAC.1
MVVGDDGDDGDDDDCHGDVDGDDDDGDPEGFDCHGDTQADEYHGGAGYDVDGDGGSCLLAFGLSRVRAGVVCQRPLGYPFGADG